MLLTHFLFVFKELYLFLLFVSIFLFSSLSDLLSFCSSIFISSFVSFFICLSLLLLTPSHPSHLFPFFLLTPLSIVISLSLSIAYHPSSSLPFLPSSSTSFSPPLSALSNNPLSLLLSLCNVNIFLVTQVLLYQKFLSILCRSRSLKKMVSLFLFSSRSH